MNEKIVLLCLFAISFILNAIVVIYYTDNVITKLTAEITKNRAIESNGRCYKLELPIGDENEIR